MSEWRVSAEHDTRAPTGAKCPFPPILLYPVSTLSRVDSFARCMFLVCCLSAVTITLLLRAGPKLKHLRRGLVPFYARSC